MKNIKIVILHLLINLIFLQISNAQNTYSETGIASYYATKFHGKKTASGEKYDMNKFTAAHNTLPFNTYVKVTNLTTNQCIVVKINDRGPHSKNRIIDLSGSAAKKISLIQSGVAKVKIEVIPPPISNNNIIASTPSTKDKNTETLKTGKLYTPGGTEVTSLGYVIQLASYTDLEKLKIQAEKLKPQIKNLYIEKSVVNSKIVYRILSGNFSTKELAQKELEIIKSNGHNGFVRKF